MISLVRTKKIYKYDEFVINIMYIVYLCFQGIKPLAQQHANIRITGIYCQYQLSTMKFHTKNVFQKENSLCSISDTTFTYKVTFHLVSCLRRYLPMQTVRQLARVWTRAIIVIYLKNKQCAKSCRFDSSSGFEQGQTI